MRALRLLAKGLLLGIVMSLGWGLLYYVLARGSLSHGIQAAVIMGVTWVLFLALATLAVAGSQHVRLWIRTRSIRKPRWRLLLATGAIFGAAQGGIALYFERSLVQAFLVASIWLSFFLVYPPLLWWLFRGELDATPLP
jgi:uncharacterized membrane protein YhaH (DUF805 family)